MGRLQWQRRGEIERQDGLWRNQQMQVEEAAADDVDAFATAEMVADEVSCRLDGHTEVPAAKTDEESCVGITSTIVGGGGVSGSSSSFSQI